MFWNLQSRRADVRGVLKVFGDRQHFKNGLGGSGCQRIYFQLLMRFQAFFCLFARLNLLYLKICSYFLPWFNLVLQDHRKKRFEFPLLSFLPAHTVIPNVILLAAAVSYVSSIFFIYLYLNFRSFIFTRGHQQNHHHFAGKQAVSARHYPHPATAGEEVEATDAAMGKRPRGSLFTSEETVWV